MAKLEGVGLASRPDRFPTISMFLCKVTAKHKSDGRVGGYSTSCVHGVVGDRTGTEAVFTMWNSSRIAPAHKAEQW